MMTRWPNGLERVRMQGRVPGRETLILYFLCLYEALNFMVNIRVNICNILVRLLILC